MLSVNALVYEGLLVFHNTLVPFLEARLQQAYKDGWWTSGVERALGKEWATRLQETLDKAHRKTLSAVQRDWSQTSGLLDIGHFLPIIQSNWKGCFSEIFRERNTTEVWLGEIIEIRNAVAHPGAVLVAEKDALRSLDTMERFLRPVSPEASERIARIIDQLRRSAAIPASAGPKDSPQTGFSSDQEVLSELWVKPFDYNLGFEHLRRAIVEQHGRTSEEHVQLEHYRGQLISALNRRHETPGVTNTQAEIEIRGILLELDRMALELTGRSFTDLSLAKRSNQLRDEHEALILVSELKGAIAQLEDKLYRKEVKKKQQYITGVALPRLEREIDQIEKDLEDKRLELEDLLAHRAPAAYFRVRRRFNPDLNGYYVEEQQFEITIELTNLGRHRTRVAYEERLPEGCPLLTGSLTFEGEFEPSETSSSSYSVSVQTAGRYIFSTRRLEYEGRFPEWDQIEEDVIRVSEGKPPALTARRYYRIEEHGLHLLVNLINTGDRSAMKIDYCEEIRFPVAPGCVLAQWKGSLRGLGGEQTIEVPLPVLDPQRVELQEKIEISYQGSRGELYSASLPAGWERIIYSFPVATDTGSESFGREGEIRRIQELLEDLHWISRGKELPSSSHVLLIEGIEGTGKTQLVHHLLRLSVELGFTCYVEDAKDRSPIKRMLRRLLGLKAEEVRERTIRNRLEEILPGEVNSFQRKILLSYISPTSPDLHESEMKVLMSHLMSLVSILSRGRPHVLVFENAQWTSEGIEEDLLLAMFHNALLAHAEPLLLCATFRPGERDPSTSLKKLGGPHEHNVTLRLEPINYEAARRLIDHIVFFPRFDEPLYRFVLQWSRNPLYMIELLRLLTDPKREYLRRSGGRWQLAPGVDLERITPDIGAVILHRVEGELPDEANLAKALSAIGFELPDRLIERLVEREFPQWPKDEFQRRLDALQRAGILSLKEEGYEFEHQIKREILYASLPEPDKLRLRQAIAEILISEEVFVEPDEQIRQLARHLIKSQHDFKVRHWQRVRQAAELERRLRNLTRSLVYYNATAELVADNSLEAAEIFLDSSRIYQMRGDWLAAVRELGKAAQVVAPASAVAKQNPKKAAALRILLEIEQGKVSLHQPQIPLDKAAKLLESARRSLEGRWRITRLFAHPSSEDFQELVDLHIAMAEVWLRRRHFRKCRRSCRRAERIARSMHRGEGLLVHVYLTLGDLYKERGATRQDFERAKSLYQTAFEHAGDDRYQLERAGLRLAEAHRILGELEQAKAAYMAAIKVQEEIGDAHGLALSHAGLGELLVEEQRFEEARMFCEKAYQHQRLVGDLHQYWRICLSLAEICARSGEMDTAVGYWFDARRVLIEQEQLAATDGRSKQRIKQLLYLCTDYLTEQGAWARRKICLLDLEAILPLISWNREELCKIEVALGETSFKTNRWQEAIDAYLEALADAETPALRAEIHERLGDVYAAYEPAAASRRREEEITDPAEHAYEESVTLWARSNDSDRAAAVYEKLLSRIVSDETGLLQLPFTFLRILRAVDAQSLREVLVERAVELLCSKELFTEAGDIMVYTARELSKEQYGAIFREKALHCLKRAEELYERNHKGLIWGFQMLIPSFYFFDLWQEVARCFDNLVDLSLEFDDEGELLEDFMALGELHDKLEIDDFKHFLEVAFKAESQMSLGREDRSRLLLQIAKCYSHIADKTENEREKEEYQRLALEYYERLMLPGGENLSLAATAFNDSALIYKQRGDLKEALRRLEYAIQCDEKLGNQTGEAHVRVNHAALLMDLDRLDEARDDYERALDHLEVQVTRWNRRLSFEDQNPLSPYEVINLRTDKRWLAVAYAEFAMLLRSVGDHEQEANLRDLAATLFEEIGMAKEAAQQRLLQGLLGAIESYLPQLKPSAM